MIAVNYSVIESLPQSGFNLPLVSRNATALGEHEDEVI
jgi:hypothetical protein